MADSSRITLSLAGDAFRVEYFHSSGKGVAVLAELGSRPQGAQRSSSAEVVIDEVAAHLELPTSEKPRSW